MKKRDKTLYTLFAMIISLIGAAFTYGFFTAGVNNNDRQEVSITTGDMVLTFADGNAGFNVKLGLGESVTKTFTIENTGSLNTYASISWVDLINTYMEGSLTYTLSYSSRENNDNIFGSTAIIIGNKNIPRSETYLTEKLCDPIPIPANTKYYFALTTTFNDTGKNQNTDLEAVFNSKFKFNAETMYNTITLADSGVTNETPYLKGPIARNTIESIEMMTSKEVPSDAIGSWDVSYYQNKSVIAWYKDVDSNGLYEVYIGQDGGIKANPNLSLLFNCLKNLKVLNLNNFDTTNVYDMSALFQNSSNIETLDLSNFNTKKITDMSAMFLGNTTEGYMNIKSINFGDNWDTSNVINMRGMFQGCNKLESLDLSAWNTSKVISMQSMFVEAHALKELNLNTWNTSKVTDMSGMFSSSGSTNRMGFTELKVSNFDTKNVTNMKGMFQGCNKLESLDLSTWNTSKVENTSNMFLYAEISKDLKLNNANFSKVTTYSNMFKNSKIDSITINPISETFINSRLTEAGLTPTITIAS